MNRKSNFKVELAQIKHMRVINIIFGLFGARYNSFTALGQMSHFNRSKKKNEAKSSKC
jgi:hypothetical protein